MRVPFRILLTYLVDILTSVLLSLLIYIYIYIYLLPPSISYLPVLSLITYLSSTPLLGSLLYSIYSTPLLLTFSCC